MAYQVNVPVGDAKKGETAPYRNAKVAKAPLVRPIGWKCSTVHEFFNEAADRHGKQRKVQAWRELTDVHFETKTVQKKVDGKLVDVDKTWTYYEKSDYHHWTYAQLQENVNDYGRGLVQLGVTPGGSERMHIFASTSPKWMRSFLAAQSQSIPVVTAYDTLGEEGVTHSMIQTESVAIFTDNALLPKLINPIQKATNVRYIIHSDPIDASDKRGEGSLYKEAKEAADKILEVRPDVKIISYDEIVALGKKSRKEIDFCLPKPEDVSCIMYTSGSTGTPKGVVLTHANIVAGIGGVSLNVYGHIDTKDRVIAFLPLAHIFELVFELMVFYWGGTIGYASVKTLTDASCRNCEGDMKTFKPTVMVGVAAVWESVKKGIISQIEKQPSTTQKVFWAAYSAKETAKKYHLPLIPSLVDNVIFKKIKAATGGQMKIMLNGGSPLSGETQRFISNTIGPMLIGYGLTETCANTCVLDPDHYEFDVAGSLVGSVTVKLIDVPDAGYFAKDNKGEVLIQGAPVLREYFLNDEETTKAFEYEKGWFSTGDIGQWMPNGALKLIDRKKNLVKTQNGEYIALEKLESIYRSNKYVANICCYADENHVKPVGIVMANEPQVSQLIVDLGLSKSSDNIEVQHFLNDPKLLKAMNKSILDTGKKGGLEGIELILGICLVEEEWTPENGFVTSAQKLQRKKILASVQDKVDKIYESN